MDVKCRSQKLVVKCEKIPNPKLSLAPNRFTTSCSSFLSKARTPCRSMADLRSDSRGPTCATVKRTDIWSHCIQLKQNAEPLCRMRHPAFGNGQLITTTATLVTNAEPPPHFRCPYDRKTPAVGFWSVAMLSWKLDSTHIARYLLLPSPIISVMT